MEITGDASVQGSEAWKKLRSTKVMASELPIIVGKSPWCTPYLLWKRKLGFTPEQSDNYAMKRGRDLEPIVRDMANNELKANFEPSVVVHDDLQWAGASLDGIDLEKEAILEIKCIGSVDHQCAKDGKVPEKYYDQLQWQLFCAGLDLCFYVSFCNQNLKIIEVKKDEKYIEDVLLQPAAEFYRCLVEMVEPTKEEVDVVHIEDKDFGNYAQEWKKSHEQLNICIEKEKYYKNKLVGYTDDGNCRGYGVSLTRVERKGNIEWEKLWEETESLYPEISEKITPEKYRKKQSGYWKISEYDT